MGEMSDQELLHAFVAVQMGFMTPSQMTEALGARAQDAAPDLLDHLVVLGLLSPPQRESVEKLAQDVLLGIEQSIISRRYTQVTPDMGPARLTVEHPGRYTIQGEQGQGGQSLVYQALDAHVGRTVAFKELQARPGRDDEEATRRFLREARITAQLEHPNIVPVYEIGRRQDGRLYYTMKLVHGRTLSQALKACTSYQDRSRLLIHVADVCQAIAYAHSQGIIHRDIKPDNIMVGEFGETVVLDWGLAKTRGKKDEMAGALKARVNLPQDPQQTIAGSVMGTPAYMSPEQARGDIDDVDERSDVWSLGAVLYEVLAGRPAMEGKPYEIIYRLMTKPEYPPVRTVCPQAPPELAAVAEHALQGDRSKRYAGAGELAAELAAFQSGRRVSVYEYSSRELLRQFVKKNEKPIAVGLVMTGLLFVLVFAAFVVTYSAALEARDEREVAQKYVNRMLVDLPDDMARLPGSSPVVAKMLGWSKDYYEHHVDRKRSSRPELRSLAETYMRMGDMALNLGDAAEAEVFQHRAQDIFEQLKQQGDDASLRDLSVNLEYLARLSLNQGDARQALEQLTEARDIHQGLIARDSRNWRKQWELATIEGMLGEAEQALGTNGRGRDHFAAEVALCQKLNAALPGQSDVENFLIDGSLKLAFLDPQHSPARIQEMLLLAESRARQDPDNARKQRDLASCYNASAQNGRAAEILGRLHQADPQPSGLAADLAEAACVAGDYVTARHAAQDALHSLRHAPALEVVMLAYAAVAEHLAGHAASAHDLSLQAAASARKLHCGLGWNFYGALQELKQHATPANQPVQDLLAALDHAAGDTAARDIAAALDRFAAQTKNL